jgi:hypothetical protein
LVDFYLLDFVETEPSLSEPFFSIISQPWGIFSIVVHDTLELGYEMSYHSLSLYPLPPHPVY